MLPRQPSYHNSSRYNASGELKDAFVIGVAGSSASGKTTVAEEILKRIDVPWVTILSMDSFYKVLNKEELEHAHSNNYNFDIPAAFDFELLISSLKRLKDGKKIEVPVYDFTTHSRSKQAITLYGANVIIFEGILAFTNKELRDLMDVKVFVDEDSDVCLARRLKRDIESRGREVKGALAQYHRFVKPSYDSFIKPSMQHADLVIPRGVRNKVAMDLLVKHVNKQLLARGFSIRKSILGQSGVEGTPENLHVIRQTPLIKMLHTIIRDATTERDSFVFHAERLSRLVLEYSLSLLPFSPCEVTSSSGNVFNGNFLNTKVCGVSIMRAGLTMEGPLRCVCKDVALGKILIQTNDLTGEPELHYCKLPRDLTGCSVLLMDASVATGAAAIMAIRVLLDHDVQQENIVLVTLLASQTGVRSVAYVFPRVKIVTTAVDDIIDDNFHIHPGFGNYGDRYFGTKA